MSLFIHDQHVNEPSSFDFAVALTREMHRQFFTDESGYVWLSDDEAVDWKTAYWMM